LACENGSLYFLDAATGEKKREFAIDAPLRCMPTISEGRVALAGCDAKLHVVDASTGMEVESLEIDSQTGSTPAALDGHVFFGTEGGTFYNLTTSPAMEVWHYRDPRRAQPIRSAASVTEDLVLFGTNSKMLCALDRATGEPRWQFPLRTGMENSPVVSGEHVFFASGRGRLYGVHVKTGEEVWQYEAGGDFAASPAVAQGRLVIGNTDGTLYCFGSNDD
jgi:outer membrane protein assembly factor BamB